MTGPSAIGSLNGTPSSISVAPAFDNAISSCSVVARSGSPAVINGMRPFFPCCFKLVKTSAMRPKLLRLQNFAYGIYVLVSASGKVHDYHLIALHLARSGNNREPLRTRRLGRKGSRLLPDRAR